MTRVFIESGVDLVVGLMRLGADKTKGRSGRWTEVSVYRIWYPFLLYYLNMQPYPLGQVKMTVSPVSILLLCNLFLLHKHSLDRQLNYGKVPGPGLCCLF